MEVIVELPDDIAKLLGEAAQMPQRMLEALAAEAYRSQQLSRRQLSVLLALDYWQTDDFITRHDVRPPYTLADLEVDRQSLAALPKR